MRALGVTQRRPGAISLRGKMGRIPRLATAASAGLALVGGIGAMWSAPASASQLPISMVAKVQLELGSAGDAQSGNEVMLDPGARRLLFWAQTGGPHIEALDLDTYNIVATAPDLFVNGSNFPWALDPRTHQLFHLQSSGSTPTLELIDTRTLKITGTQSLPQDMADPEGGFYWSQREQLLYYVYAPGQLSAGTTSAIAAINPYASSVQGAVVWRAPLPGCGIPLRTNNASALGETSDGRYLYTVCTAPHGTGQGPGDVVRLALPGSPPADGIVAGQDAVTLFPGIVTGAESSALWIPNADRMVVLAASNGTAGWSAYIFDARTLHFVSAPALFTPSSDGHLAYETPAFGVAPATGRLFAVSRAFAAHGRDPNTHSPCLNIVPNSSTIAIDETGINGASPLHFPAGDDGIDGVGHLAAYDPVGRNWWMFDVHTPPQQGDEACNPYGTPDASYLLAFHDTIAPAAQPPAVDPDRATWDIPEASGVTGANANADASAYGVHYVVGPSGTEGVVAATGDGTCDLNADFSRQQAGTPSQFPILDAPPAPQQYHAFCNSHGRMATFAHVDRVSLDGSEVRATAITGDTDHETGHDLAAGTDYSQPGPYMNSVVGYSNTTATTLASPNAGPPSLPMPCPAPASAPPSPSSGPAAMPWLLVTPTPLPNEPTQCDQDLQPVQPYLTGASLPYSPASCADNGGGSDQSQSSAPATLHGLPSGSPILYPGSASAFCSYAEQKAQGYAEQANTSLAGPLDDPIAAKTAVASAMAMKSTVQGSGATANATVKDITVGSFLHIAELATSAMAVAHGRPGTNKPQYSCEIVGLIVTLPENLSLPSGVPSYIPSADCSSGPVQDVAAALNDIFTGQLHIEFPLAPTTADDPPGGDAGVVQRQSSKGYLSEVALSELDQAQNAIMVNDTGIEQPGMVVTYYLDNQSARNHLVASFAGVEAAARYGIYPLSADGGDGGDLGGGDGFPPPATGILPGDLATALPGGTGFASGGSSGGGGNSDGPLVNPVAIAQAVVNGLRVLFEHPELIPPLLAVWLLFASPGYMMLRRRSFAAAT